MKEYLTPTETKCPECGQGRLLSFTRDEEFDFERPLAESSAASIAFKSHRQVPEIGGGSLPARTQVENACADIPQYAQLGDATTREG